LLLSGALPLLVACGSSPAPQAVPIAQPLPDSESLDYTLLDTNEQKIGGATLSIQRQGNNLVLRQLYTQQDGSTDNVSVTVDAATLRPQSSMRTITAPSLTTSVAVTYSANSVSAVATSGSQQHKQSQKLSVPAYDDGESFFLMRAVQFTSGYSVHYADVASDAKSAHITRVLAEIKVAGQVQVSVQGKSLPAWEVQFSAAGASATGWFENAPARRLLRYANPATTSIELANP
jgi:hypothetical protein